MEKELKDSEIKLEVKSDSVKIEPVKKIDDIFGTFRVTDTAPTGKPIKFADQIVVYKNSTTYRLYWYDPQNNEWHYVTATA